MSYASSQSQSGNNSFGDGGSIGGDKLLTVIILAALVFIAFVFFKKRK